MPTQIKRQRIHEQIVDHLKEYIIANALTPGDALPTEAALAEELGVGRPAVREALRVMESLGIAQSRASLGTRLKPMSMKPITDQLQFWLDVQGISVTEMARARRVMECAILEEVAINADENDFRRIKAASDRARELYESGKSFTEADIEFHLALLQATKNRALEGFGVMLQEFFTHVRARSLSLQPERLQDIEEHEQIYEALRNKDVATAQKIMHAHMYIYENMDTLLHPPGKENASST